MTRETGNDRLGVAVIGLGGRGLEYFAVNFQRARGVRLVAVADLDKKRRDTARNALGEGILYLHRHSDLASLDGVDAVAVATNGPTHAPITIDLLRAGKHVICEKPMADTAADCRRMIAAARKAGRQLAVGFCLRYGAFFLKMKQLVDQGAIGRVIMGTGYDAVEAGARYYFHNAGRDVGSLTLEKGVHTIDIVNWIMGSQPRRVAAFGGLNYFGGDKPRGLKCPQCPEQKTCPEDSMKQRDRWLPEHFDPAFQPYSRAAMPDDCVFRRDITYKDNLTAIIEYANGARGNYIECHFTPAYTRRFVFIGDRGEMTADSWSGRITIHERFTQKVYRLTARGRGDHGGGDAGQMKAWIKALRSGAPLEPPGETGYYATAVAEAIDASIEQGKIVTIPPLA